MFRSFLAAAALAALHLPAHALTVTFIEPDGVVGPNDDIPVYIRLTADSDIAFDGNDVAGNFGIDPGLVPTEGFYFSDAGPVRLPFESLTRAIVSTSFTCSGSFTDGGDSPCAPGDNYDFEFSLADGEGIIGLNTLDLAAGESQDFLFGTFTPLEGGAAPGDYNFFGANVGFLFFGTGIDEFGQSVDVLEFVTLGTTCTTGDFSCDFSRVVVPVPAAAWLFVSALGLLVGTRRRTA